MTDETTETTEMTNVNWLSPRRFAAKARLPVSSVYHYVRSGRLSSIRHGGRIWIHEDLLELREWELGRGRKGVVPPRYRDARGHLLPGVQVPRSELLWGTAAEQVERAYAIANSTNDLFHAADMPGEVLVEADRGLTHRFLY